MVELAGSGALKHELRFRGWGASGLEHSGNGSGIMSCALFPIRFHASAIIPHRHLPNSCHLLSHLVHTPMAYNETIATPAVTFIQRS